MRRHTVLIAVGLILTLTGLYLLRTLAEPQRLLRALPYVLIGLGCGAFGQGAGTAVSRRGMKNAPELQKQEEIARKDERNVAIVNRAKARAFDVMLYVFGALLLALALMGTDLVAVLLLVFCYLFVEGSSVFYRLKFEKEM